MKADKVSKKAIVESGARKEELSVSDRKCSHPTVAPIFGATPFAGTFPENLEDLKSELEALLLQIRQSLSEHDGVDEVDFEMLKAFQIYVEDTLAAIEEDDFVGAMTQMYRVGACSGYFEKDFRGMRTIDLVNNLLSEACKADRMQTGLDSRHMQTKATKEAVYAAAEIVWRDDHEQKKRFSDCADEVLEALYQLKQTRQPDMDIPTKETVKRWLKDWGGSPAYASKGGRPKKI